MTTTAQPTSTGQGFKGNDKLLLGIVLGHVEAGLPVDRLAQQQRRIGTLAGFVQPFAFFTTYEMSRISSAERSR